jgi:hypothetical protein
MAELAGLVKKVTKSVISPPVAHWPVLPSKTLKVHLIFVHERHIQRSTVETAAQMQELKERRRRGEEQRKKGGVAENGEHISTSRTSSTSEGASEDATIAERASWELYPDDLDPTIDPSQANDVGGYQSWSDLDSTLLGLALPDQTVEVYNHHLRFEECEQCVQAYTQALRTHTTNVLTSAQTGAPASLADSHTALRSQVTNYLDASALKDWLEHFNSRYWDIDSTRGDAEASRDDEDNGAAQRVVKVFVYDLAAPGIVLLDRFHQSVGFPGEDIIVAVQTRAPQAVVDFSCDAHPLLFDARDASRSTLGSILTTVYGITPSLLQWSTAKNDTETDFLLTVGAETPYALFAPHTSKGLHWGIRDAA